MLEQVNSECAHPSRRTQASPFLPRTELLPVRPRTRRYPQAPEPLNHAPLVLERESRVESSLVLASVREVPLSGCAKGLLDPIADVESNLL